MPRLYSLDLRERVLQFYDEGHPVENVVRHFSVRKSWFYNLLKQRRETGMLTPKVRPTQYKTKLTPHEQEVGNTIAEHADATLSERYEMLEKHVSDMRCALLFPNRPAYVGNELFCLALSIEKYPSIC